MSGALEGKRALVTGGSSGIGFETARLLRDEGANVALIARDPRRLEEAARVLGDDVVSVAADVGDASALGSAIAKAAEGLGGIDILFVNAGVSETPPFADTDVRAFDAFMDINVKGAIFTVVHALPHLSNGASIVLTGSVAARRGWPGDPVYAASKGAIRSFGRALAVEEGILARRIRVNVVTPGAIATRLTKPATDDPEIRRYVEERIPMKRWGEASEVARAVLFLASDASSYVTGAELTVDGGLAHA